MAVGKPRPPCRSRRPAYQVVLSPAGSHRQRRPEQAKKRCSAYGRFSGLVQGAAGVPEPSAEEESKRAPRGSAAVHAAHCRSRARGLFAD